jgi:hypothetical protein
MLTFVVFAAVTDEDIVLKTGTTDGITKYNIKKMSPGLEIG